MRAQSGAIRLPARRPRAPGGREPTVADDEVLVRVRARRSTSPTGTRHGPAVSRARRWGCAGRRASGSASTSPGGRGVGKDVTEFEPGDEVFGGRDGAFAEYVCVREERDRAKPAN